VSAADSQSWFGCDGHGMREPGHTVESARLREATGSAWAPWPGKRSGSQIYPLVRRPGGTNPRLNSFAECGRSDHDWRVSVGDGLGQGSFRSHRAVNSIFGRPSMSRETVRVGRPKGKLVWTAGQSVSTLGFPLLAAAGLASDCKGRACFAATIQQRYRTAVQSRERATLSRYVWMSAAARARPAINPSHILSAMPPSDGLVDVPPRQRWRRHRCIGAMLGIAKALLQPHLALAAALAEPSRLGVVEAKIRSGRSVGHFMPATGFPVVTVVQV